MIKESDFETYLIVTPNHFGIYLFDKEKFKNLYQEEISFLNYENSLNLKLFYKFLDDNVFKIEKLIGKFIENIFLIINNENILNVKIGIKKKNYKEIINNHYLENTLTGVKELFNETYQNYKIMHMIVNKYEIDGKYYSSIVTNLNSNYVCLETELVSLPNSLADQIEKVLEKYQIKVIRFLDEKYIKNFSVEKSVGFVEMAHNIASGFNENEIMIVKKIPKKRGFFEKFFQLFS